MKLSKHCSLIALLVLLLASPAAISQNARELLTNAKIIELVRMGLSESLIVAKINRSDCQCDTSTAAMAKLKAARVSDAVIMAMMNSSSEGVSPSRNQETRAQTDHPTKDLQDAISGQSLTPSAIRADNLGYFSVVLVNGSERLSMKKALPNAKVDSSGMLIPYIGIFKKVKTASVFAGNHSQFRVRTTSPVFEVSIPNDLTAGDTISLVKLEVTKNTRQLQTGRAGVTGGTSGYRKEDLIPITFEELRVANTHVQPTTVVRVRLVTAIPPGEYAVIAPGGVYDFGIDAGL